MEVYYADTYSVKFFKQLTCHQMHSNHFSKRLINVFSISEVYVNKNKGAVRNTTRICLGTRNHVQGRKKVRNA